MTTRSQTATPLALRRTNRVGNFFGHIHPNSTEAAPRVDLSRIRSTHNTMTNLPPHNPQLTSFFVNQSIIHSDPDSDYSPTSNRSYIPTGFEQLSIYDRWNMDTD